MAVVQRNQAGYQFEVRNGRIVLNLGQDGQLLDVTDALVVSLNLERPTVDVTGFGDQFATHMPTGELRVTLDMVMRDEPVKPQDQSAAPQQPEEPAGQPKRVSVPPEDQRRSQRILGRSRGDR